MVEYEAIFRAIKQELRDLKKINEGNLTDFLTE